MHGTASKNGTASFFFFFAGPLGSQSLLLQNSATVPQTVSVGWLVEHLYATL
jgi:hypothetical protein